MTFFDREKWGEIYYSLSRHKLRAILTAFGVFWGIFMLVVLLGAGKGLEKGATSRFGDYTNVIFLWTRSKTQLAYRGFDKGRSIPLQDEDVEAINQNISSVKRVYGLNRLGRWASAQYVTHGNKSGAFSVNGSHPGLAAVHSIEVTKGRYLNQQDMDERRKVAIIGERVKKVLFGPDVNPIGKQIIVYGLQFQVVGVSSPTSSDTGRQSIAETIYIPNTTLRQAFNQSTWFAYLIVLPKDGFNAELVDKEVKDFLKDRRNIHPKDVGVVMSHNKQERFEQIQGLFIGIAAFSWIVAAGTIAAGAIGVGNIMLITVKERTREIGLRKAVGATPMSIVVMILQESIALTLVAGYAGLVAGVGALEFVSKLMRDSNFSNEMFSYPEIDFQTALVAMLVLVASGALASLLPALKAAKVDPIIALQDE